MSRQNPYRPPVARLGALALVAFVVVGGLLAQLWNLQAVNASHWQEVAENNRVRSIITDPPRGRILDRSGRPLADSRVADAVTVWAEDLLKADGSARDSAAETLDRLAALLGEPADEFARDLHARRSRFTPTIVALDAPASVTGAIRRDPAGFVGVAVEPVAVRHYPHGTTAAHTLGYLGQITDKMLATSTFAGYRQGDVVGLTGLEAVVEHHLRGESSTATVEVDALGRITGELDVLPSVPGNDVATSIDLRLQLAVEDALHQGLVNARTQVRDDGVAVTAPAGAAVAIDVRTGDVLAIASHPTFDPAEFIGGVSYRYWDWLSSTESHTPLLNRVIQSAWPPASTFKVVTVASALEEGQIEPSTRLACPPVWHLGAHAFRNWLSSHDGHLDAAGALARSCDTFLYPLAYQQWRADEARAADQLPPREPLAAMSRRFGFGRTTGIDLPVESAGVVPDRGWKRDLWQATRNDSCRKASEAEAGTYAKRLFTELCETGWRLRGGDLVNQSIGQGDVLTTPLQVAVAYAAIANGGDLVRPRLLREVVDPAGNVVETFPHETTGSLDLDEDYLAVLRDGLEQVVMAPRGTAAGAFAGFPLDRYPVAGKTGTGEANGKAPYAWFAAYAPADDPRVAVVVAIEQGNGGSTAAAPTVRRILESYFRIGVSPWPHEIAEAEGTDEADTDEVDTDDVVPRSADHAARVAPQPDRVAATDDRPAPMSGLPDPTTGRIPTSALEP